MKSIVCPATRVFFFCPPDPMLLLSVHYTLWGTKYTLVACFFGFAYVKGGWYVRMVGFVHRDRGFGRCETREQMHSCTTAWALPRFWTSSFFFLVDVFFGLATASVVFFVACKYTFREGREVRVSLVPSMRRTIVNGRGKS